MRDAGTRSRRQRFLPSHTVKDVVVIFRTHSDIEAQIVRGLLEAHGVMSVASSDVLHSVFPMSVDGLMTRWRVVTGG